MRGIAMMCWVLVGLALSGRLETAPLQDLKDLYTNKRYFDLRAALLVRRNQQTPDLLFYRGAIASKFDRVRASISSLPRHIREGGSNADPDLVLASYEMLADDYLTTSQHGKAAGTYQTM